jgi:hypothetical protein
MTAEDRTACRTPNGDGSTNIPSRTFDLCRAAIPAELDTNAPVRVAEMPDRVGHRLTADGRDRPGSPGWHVTAVRLEMEVRGEIARLEGSPLRLRKS